MKNIHIVVASGVWDLDHLRYRRHRLAEYLKRREDTQDVIWLCPAVQDHPDAFITLKNGIRQWSITDLLPYKIFRFSRFIDFFYRSKLDPFVCQLHAQNNRLYLWYTFPGFPLLADQLSWEKVIYDCSDLWTSPISGRFSFLSKMRSEIIHRAEKRIIDRADRIFCTSDYLKKHVIDQLRGTGSDSVTTLENGVEFSWFNRPGRWIKPLLPEGFHGPVLGYIGGIKPKLDFQLVYEAAQKRPDWFFLFIGPNRAEKDPEFEQLLQLKNVTWAGSIAPDEVPDYMQLVDIGIMPYKSSPYNSAVFPLKLFEFLAAGKPAVGVCLPSTQEYAEEGIYAHLQTADSKSFVQACSRLLAAKQSASEEKFRSRRRELARQKDWPEIFRKMTGFLDLQQNADERIGSKTSF